MQLVQEGARRFWRAFKKKKDSTAVDAVLKVDRIDGTSR